MVYHFISIICIIISLIISIGCTLAFFRKERSKKIDFIRKFKKGNCAVVYMVAIPLYWIGHIYAGQSVFPAFFSAINKTMGLVVLSYDMSSISSLMADNNIYTIAVYFCFFLVAINAMLFAISFLHQKIWEWFQRRQWNWSRKEKLLIVGNNEENLKISSSEQNRAVMLLDEISDKEKTKLYAKKVRFVSKNRDVDDISKKHKKNLEVTNNGIEEYCCRLLSKCLSDPKKSCIIVINTKDDDQNIALCQKIISCTNEFFKGKDAFVIAKNLNRIRVYVFGMPIHENIYNSIVEASNGCIHYINKYRQIAMDFVDRYPLTQFMTGKQIDYKTSLLRSGVNVNVAMIGFGKTNQQIFLTSVANNQFLVENEGKTVLKKVQYHIFDKQYLENNKNLNHNYYRFKNEFMDKIEAQENGQDNQYLPFPALPADDHYDKLDVNDSDFYKKIRNALDGEGNFNYIIIGFGTDLENIDMAQKLLEKKQEWGLENTYVFVKVRGGGDGYSIFKRNDCYIIGDEERAVYNIKRINDDIITAMAKMRNRIYSLESAIASKPNKMFIVPVEKTYAQADCDWYNKKTQFERESNLYACLSLRSKLHLMGMDYIHNDFITKENDIVKREAYLDCYAGDDRPVYYDNELADGKEIVKYDLNFKNSRRKTMAIHEHFRWNSFMLSKGFVPSSKKEIFDDKRKNGKNYSLRKHGNLTTFEGLLEFRKLIVQRGKQDELAADVIKYDYQLLDDAYWLLSNNNYQIIRRKE
jgi:hypothetical protein